MKGVRVGTSGWSYDHWKGPFYPEDLPRSRWAEHYRRCFPAVEINYTFYRLPRASTVRRWHHQAPPGFRYVTKGSRLITHVRRLRGCQAEVATYLDRVAPLKAHLGAILWQLPPSLGRDEDLLEGFLRLLPRRLGGSPLRHAVEFRDPGWVRDPVLDLLASHRAAFVWVSSQRMPGVTPRTSDLVYARFHGLEGGFAHDYTEEELAPFARALRGAAGEGCDGFAFFNNDGEARAPANATTLERLLGDTAARLRR